MNDKYDFPQYRKLINNKSFYKILSNDCFEEFQLLGEKVIKYTIKANQYPEKIRIMDMLDCTEGFAISSYEQFKEKGFVNH